MCTKHHFLMRYANIYPCRTDGSVSQQNQTQSCTTTSNGITFGGFQLVEKFFIGLLVQLSESVSYTITHTNAVCDTSSITVTCPYKQGCQQLCAQQQRLNYYGYKIRRCRHGLLFGHVSDICIQDFVASVPSESRFPFPTYLFE